MSLLNLPTITYSQMMASVMDDISVYTDGSLVDESRVIKVIQRCNAVLGVNIHKQKVRLLTVKDYSTTLPLDLHKVEWAFSSHLHQLNTGFVTIEDERELRDTQVKTVFAHLNLENLWYPVDTPSGKYMYNECIDQCRDYRLAPYTNNAYTIKSLQPLRYVDRDNSLLTEYSPRFRSTDTYFIDREEGIITTSFQEGYILMSYVATLIDEDTGELLIPNEPKLYGYYEYSAKAKVLEDIFMNSEADVEKKLMYAKKEANSFFLEAADFVATAKGSQWRELNKTAHQRFYNRWVQTFY